MKRIVLSSIVGGALALATLGGVLASPAAPSADSATVAALVERPGRPDRGVALADAGLIKATADVTGLTIQQVTTELKAGKSLEQVAQSKGKTAQQVIDSARSALKQRLDQAVANSRMTQAQADAALAKFDADASTIMKDTTLGTKIGQRAERGRRGVAAGALIKATADVTGLTVQEVTSELRAGKSLAQIAQEHGKTVDDIIKKLQENLRAREQELLDEARQLANQPGLAPNTNPAATPVPTL